MLSTATTDAIAPAARLQFWNETVGSIFPGMVVDASADLRARWTSCALGDVVVATARSQRAVIRRWQGRVPGGDGGRGLIHLQHAGFSATEQCGRVAPLFGGDLTYCRPDERYGIDLSERNECYVIDLPLRMLAGVAAEPAVTIPHALPAAGMLHDFVSSILRQNWPDAAEPEEMQALGEMVGSLVRRCMTHGPAAPASSHVSQRQRVLDYVEANLGDSALRTGRIAQALSLPPRVVQSVFVAMATTPGAFIIRRRLARAAERLRDRPAHGALTDLAYELGFSDAAHFSRRFKAAFGMSPLAFARSQRAD